MKTLKRTFKGVTILIEKKNSMTFPKGKKVLITDPCYWFGQGADNDHIWQEFCKMMFPNGWEKLPEHEKLYTYGKVTFTAPNGRKIEFLYTSTASGDGHYEVKKDNYSSNVKLISGDGTFGVDAGMYAIVDMEDAKFLYPKGFKGDTFDCGTVFETLGNIMVTVDGQDMDGGDLVCKTGDEDEEEACERCGSNADYNGQICHDCHDEEVRQEEEDEEDED